MQATCIAHNIQLWEKLQQILRKIKRDNLGIFRSKQKKYCFVKIIRSILYRIYAYDLATLQTANAQ